MLAKVKETEAQGVDLSYIKSDMSYSLTSLKWSYIVDGYRGFQGGD